MPRARFYNKVSYFRCAPMYGKCRLLIILLVRAVTLPGADQGHGPINSILETYSDYFNNTGIFFREDPSYANKRTYFTLI